MMSTPVSYTGNRVSEVLGFVGMVFFALGLGVGGAPVRVGMALIVLACLLDWRRLWQACRREPLAWATFSVGAYLMLMSLWRVLQWDGDPAIVSDGLSDAMVHTCGLAFLVGWVLRGSRQYIVWMLLLASAGLVFALLNHSAPAELNLYLGGARADYRLGGNGPGLYFSTVLLGLYSVGVAALARLGPTQLVRQFVWALLFCLGVVVVVLPVVFNQSRASWLAVMLVLPCTLLIQVFAPPKPLTRYPRRVLVTLVLAVLLMGATVFGVRGIVSQRIQAEQAVVTQIAAGHQVASDSSVGARVSLWQVAMAAIVARPLFGHGPGAGAVLIDAEPSLAQYPHFHDLYLQILVESGVVGLSGVALTYGLLIRRLLQAWRRGLIATDLALFLISAWMLYFVYSFFEIRHDDIRGFAYLGILMGATFTAWLHRERSAPAKTSEAGYR